MRKHHKEQVEIPLFCIEHLIGWIWKCWNLLFQFCHLIGFHCLGGSSFSKRPVIVFFLVNGLRRVEYFFLNDRTCFFVWNPLFIFFTFLWKSPCHFIFLAGIICVLIWRSFTVRDNLRSRTLFPLRALQRIMVVVYIKTNINFKMMSKTTLIPQASLPEGIGQFIFLVEKYFLQSPVISIQIENHKKGWLTI